MTGPSTLVPADAVADCVAVVTDTFAAMVATLDGWSAELVGHGWPAAGPTPGQLDPVTRSLVLPELSRPAPTVVGAGFIARPGWVRGAPQYLSWWLGPDNQVGRAAADPSPVRRLSVDLDPGSDGYRDYTALEWWRVPAATGLPHITGPYVDYLCTDEYTLTLTAPVTVTVAADGSSPEMVGMVGMDIYVRTVESLLLPRLLRAGRPATVLNAAGRVVVSTDAHRAAGIVLRFPGLRELLAAADPTGPLPDGRELYRCPGTGLALLLDAG